MTDEELKQSIDKQLDFCECMATDLGWTVNHKLAPKILKRVILKNMYCPCVVEENEDTSCPCREKRINNHCCCNLYIDHPETLTMKEKQEQILYKMIRGYEHLPLAKSLASYVVYGSDKWTPSSFEQAIFDNDLTKSLMTADDVNILHLRDYAEFVHNTFPSGVYDGPEGWTSKEAESFVVMCFGV